jgi:hypothetical protein
LTAAGTGPQPTLTPAVAAGTPPPGRSATWLDLALDIVNEGPRPCYRAAVVSLAVTSVLAMTMAALTRPPGPLPGSQRHMIAGALVALCISATLAIASLSAGGWFRIPAWLDRVVAPRERAAIWLALAAWFPFLLIVVYYRAEATFPPQVRYIYSPYDDKRWETAAYLLGTLAPVIWVTTAARVLAVGRGQPPTWRAWFTGLFTWIAAVDQGPRVGSHAAGAASIRAGGWRSGARRMLPVAARLATALGLAWYFLGPPWHLSNTMAPISRQEDVWLIGLQAVAKGRLPYVGVAGVPYGPGTQLATYLLMHHVTSFSMVGFREAWALQVWAGASVLFAVFFLALGFARGLAVSLLSALVYPALIVVAFQPSGSYGGYLGWASPLRYAGVIAVVLLLPAAVRRCPSWRGAAAGTAIGALWGLMSYLAQENLAGGVVGALAVGVLLLFSGSSSWRAVRTALLAALVGFLLIWTPVLTFYAVHGQLGEFLSQYFLFPRAVAEGINDTPWQGFSRAPSSLTPMYHALPFLLAVLALLAVFQVRPVRIATEWSRERACLVATVLTTILLYQGVLLRSDASHLTGTLLMVPALVIMTGAVLPRLFGAQRRVTVAIAGAALVAASFVLLPAKAFAWTSVRSAAERPYLDRQQLAAAPRSGMPTTLAGWRVGPGLSGAAQCCQGAPVSMGEFVRLMERIHVMVGDRTAYVANFHGAYPGLVYFVADLNPAPISSYEYDGSTLTESQMRTYLTHFRTRVLPHTQALLTFTTKAPEARYFLRRYPSARQIKLHYDNQDYFVLLRQGQSRMAASRPGR